MLSRVASRVSLRSRERKLRLFHELLKPGPETTVVDVGVTDAPFGAGSTDNFFEALYPWPEQITAVGVTGLDRFAAAFPAVRAVQADGRELPFADGSSTSASRTRSSSTSRAGARAAAASCTSSAASSRRVFVTTPNRFFPLEVHTLRAVRPLAAARARAIVCCGRAGSTTCSSRSARASSRHSFLTACG